MSVLKREDAKKWINFFVAVVATIVCYTVIAFLGQLGEWFDLEAKIPYFEGVSQGIAIVVGLVTFLTVTRYKSSAALMMEVYDELVKVTWTDRETVIKLTIVVVVGVGILSSVFVGVDYLFQQMLELVY